MLQESYIIYNKVADIPSPFFYSLFENACMLLKNKRYLE